MGRDSISASAELLRIKESEKRQRQHHEIEERKMEQVLQKQVERIRRHNLNEETTSLGSSGPLQVADALVRMHGSDSDTFTSSSYKTKKGKSARNRCISTKQYHNLPSKSSSRHVTKKSRKSKHGY
jgi:hypothetical protein